MNEWNTRRSVSFSIFINFNYNKFNLEAKSRKYEYKRQNLELKKKKHYVITSAIVACFFFQEFEFYNFKRF